MADRTLTAAIQEKVRSAFRVFDLKDDNTVDVRETSTIIHSLNCFPTKADVHQIIVEVEENNMGYVHLDKFLPVMTRTLMENKFPAIPEERLVRAFEVLDKEKKGCLRPDQLVNYMTSEGEPFSQEEINEMLTALVDREKNLICFKELIGQLTIHPEL